MRRSLSGIDREERDLTGVGGGCEKLPPVRSCAESGHRPVPRLCQLAHRAGAAIPDDDVEAVGLEARMFLGAPREVAVAEKDRLSIPGRIIGGQILGRGAARGRHLE